LKNILTKAKKKCASGGTIRDKGVELQGDHRFKMKKLLIDLGFPEENILIQGYISLNKFYFTSLYGFNNL